MLGKSVFEDIYRMLDEVTPLAFDCGELCGAACCRTDGASQDLRLYLLPGEAQVHEPENPWLVWSTERTEDHCLPASWGETVYTVACPGPEGCERALRPIQCRTFPLEPHLTRKGALELVYYAGYLPYECPLLKGRFPLKGAFLEAVWKAWSLLITDPAIRDCVEMDSKKRGRWPRRYRTAYAPG